MINEVCYLVQVPFTKRDYARFGLQTIKSRGLRTKVLDLTFVLDPTYPRDISSKADLYHSQEIILCKNYKDVELFLKNNNSIIIIDCVDGTARMLPIYHLFKKFNVPYFKLCSNSIPWPLLQRKKMRLFDRIRDFHNIFLKIKNRLSMAPYYLPYTVNNIQPPQYILAGGRKYIKNNPRLSMATKIIWLHTLDYDLYLEHKSRNSMPIIQNPYAVFLDEYYPYHQDFYVLRENLKNPYPQPEKYYSELNNFFSKLEKKIGIPVVVAAHPRSSYEKQPYLFKDRKVIKDKTIELVAHAVYVLAHSSTSINFAVLYKKPIIFLTSSAIETTYHGKIIANFAGQFNQSPINISDGSDLEKIEGELTCDDRLYDEYKNNHIKVSGSPEKPSWDIVADLILN